MGRGSHEKEYKKVQPYDRKIQYQEKKKTKNVLDASIPFDDYVTIDLSKSNTQLAHLDLSNTGQLSQFIYQHLENHHAQVAYGGYLEERTFYKSQKFIGEAASNQRNIHLGIDFWCKESTPVLAAASGKIHSFQNNQKNGDYGPTIILEHQIQGEIFYTLYGHLSLQSIKSIHIGQSIVAGDQIGTLGEKSVNGGYPPHLHFQIIEDIQEYHGDYPGVCSREDLPFYKDNCPDPVKFLQL